MGYIIVLSAAFGLQFLILFLWKKDQLLFTGKKQDELKVLEAGSPKRKYSVKDIIEGLSAFVLTGAVCVYLYYWNADLLNFCKLMLVYFLLLLISVYDWKEHKIPNRFLAVCFLIRSILFIVEFFYHRKLMKAILISCIGGMFITLVVLLLLVLLTKQGFGMGDVKLFAIICFTIGLMPAYNLFFYSVLYTAVCSIFLLLVKKVSKKHTMPFGPFIFMAYITLVFFQLY